MAYSSLYGDQPDEVTKYVNKASQKNLTIRIAEREDHEHPRELREYLQALTRIGLKAVDVSCAGVDCIHDLWWVCGGAASFIVEYTNTFSDVDVFVHCNGNFDYSKIFAHDFGVGPIKITARGCVLELEVLEIAGTVQIIPLKLKLDMPLEKLRPAPFYQEFQDLFALFVLSRFDIPPSRVAVRFNLNSIDSSSWKVCVIDMTSFLIQYPTSLERLLKWMDRLTPKKFKIPRLSALVPFSIFSEAEAGRRLRLMDNTSVIN